MNLNSDVNDLSPHLQFIISCHFILVNIMLFSTILEIVGYNLKEINYIVFVSRKI